MKFTREDVLSMVDAAFHEFASSYRVDAKNSVNKMMDRREAKQRPNQVNRPDALECHCRGDKTCIFCGADMDKLND